VSRETSLKKIAAEIARCRTCKEGCSGKAVPGEGSAEARIVFIGEAPGREEAKTGRPFIGRSGQLLRQSIRDIGLDEAEVFITSPVHYLPDRRTPSRGMILHGREHLFRQLAVIRPKAICLLGGTAVRGVLGLREGITKIRGNWYRFRGTPVMVTYHPSFLLRGTSPTAKREAWEDLKKVLHYVYD